MLNTYYLKLLKLSFVVLLATVCIIGFTENTSYAYNQNQFVEILVDNVNTLPSSSKSAINNFLSKNLYTLPQFVFNENNDLIIISTYYSSNIGYEYDIHYIKLGDKEYAYSYENNGYLVVKFSGSVPHTRFDFYTKNSTIGTIVNSSSNNITSLTLNRTQEYDWQNRNIFIANKYMKASNSYSNNYSSNYYWKKLFSPSPTFIQNNDWSIRYGLAYQLGTILNYNLGDEIDFLLVDTSVDYDSIVARLNDGLILTDSKLYVSTNNIRTGVVYDLYYYYDNAVANIYQYSFWLVSGDNGFDVQIGTNIIVDNQNQNTQHIINNQNQNTDHIVNAIESGNNNVNDFLTSPLDLSGENISSGDIIGALDMDFVGNPYQNVWVTLIDGLRNCLVGVDREFDIEINNHTYTINLDSFSPHLPASLKTFLTLVSTTFMLLVLLRWIKLSIDKVQTANVDNLLQLNEEEGIIDLF